MTRHLNRPGPTMAGRLLTALWVLFALLMLLVITPASWGVSGLPVLLNLVSFPLAGGLILGAISIAFAVGTVSRRSQDRAVRIGVAVLVMVVAVAQVTTVARRGGWWAKGGPWQAGDVVVVSFNSLGISPMPSEFYDIVSSRRPQIIALPETTPEAALLIAADAREFDLDYQVFSQPTSPAPTVTSLLIETGLGEYEKDRDASDGVALRAVPVDGDGPVVVAVHPQSPSLLGSNFAAWKSAGRQAVAECVTTPGAIVAGDFNATIDHPQFSALGSCRDSAAQAGRAAQGTWPADLPATLSSAIDHVLVDGDRWQSIDFGTARVGRSDHRLIVATIRER